ncbi:MAG: type I 3-dehydroquinate dehydratase [Eubacteriaceae bacterium]|nr:type I 3-dehydroquinate dehydratase [Eubacteriaceae bacterium]
MKTVEMAGVVIGEGLPKICIPLMAEKEDELEEQGKKADDLPCDLVEWRADYMGIDFLRDIDRMAAAALRLRKATSKPVIITIRTSEEGGMAKLDRRDYYSIIRDVAEEVDADGIDIEAFDEQQGFNAEKIEFLVGIAHSRNKKVILSSHDFSGTPDRDVMAKRLIVMQELGADIPKIAVMPKEEQDVEDLIEAAHIMKEKYCRRPFIALSMGELGAKTRVCGGSFGSAVTFAGGGKAAGMETSAPGQMEAEKLKAYICDYYRDNV